MKEYLFGAWLILVAATLFACGGGSGNGSANAAINADINANSFTSAILSAASNTSETAEPADINTFPATTAADTTEPVPII